VADADSERHERAVRDFQRLEGRLADEIKADAKADFLVAPDAVFLDDAGNFSFRRVFLNRCFSARETNAVLEPRKARRQSADGFLYL
jgi:hypothetical protein